MSDHGDELQERLDELGRRVQAEYDADPVGMVIRSLRDQGVDYYDVGDFDPAFMRGYRQAIHNALEVYIVYSGEFSCQCEDGPPHVDEMRDGWQCTDCGEMVVESKGDALGEPPDARARAYFDGDVNE